MAPRPEESQAGARFAVQLDVAAGELARREVTVRQRDRERVLAPRLTVVGHDHLVGDTAPVGQLSGALDPARNRPGDFVTRHPGALDLEAGAMVDVRQVAPQ